MPESSKKPKIYAKRDLVVATKEQKEKFRNTKEPEKKKKKKRAIIGSTSESDSTENRIEKMKKQKKANPRFTSEFEIDNEEEAPGYRPNSQYQHRGRVEKQQGRKTKGRPR